MGGADAGGGLDGQSLPMLGDFYRWAGGRCHCNLPQENIHTWRRTKKRNIKLAAVVKSSPGLVCDEWKEYTAMNKEACHWL